MNKDERIAQLENGLRAIKAALQTAPIMINVDLDGDGLGDQLRVYTADGTAIGSKPMLLADGRKLGGLFAQMAYRVDIDLAKLIKEIKV